jgi:hypothetical protein
MSFDDTIWVNPETGLLEAKYGSDFSGDPDLGVSDYENYLRRGAWTSFTPSFYVGSAAGIKVNGNVGEYLKYGDMVYFYAGWTLGAGLTGSGNLLFNLPVQRKPSVKLYKNFPIEGYLHTYDTSGGVEISASLYGFQSADLQSICVAVNPSATISQSYPFVWASGDTIAITGAYRVIND